MKNALFNLTYEASDILNVIYCLAYHNIIKALKQRELLSANQSLAKPKESVTATTATRLNAVQI